MRKLIAILVMGSALGLTACAADGSADYSYESQAPYADERTVGEEGRPAPAERVFESKQRK